jgi:hypothetical protein
LIAALAGRRIDALGAEPRFPSDRIQTVHGVIAEQFRSRKVTGLVSSAACGADLIAIHVSMELDICFRIVLPYGIDDFRRSSVVDRPGKWEAIYDEAIGRAQIRGDLIVLNVERNAAGYRSANQTIIDEAVCLSVNGATSLIAIAIWDSKRRNSEDATADFVDRATSLHLPILSIPTL